MIELNGKYSSAKIFIDDVESEALSLIMNVINQEVSNDAPVRIMPDVHAGKGIVIGFTMPLTELLSPAYVGVDIGCGMMSASFSVKKGLDLVNIDKKIKENVPMGFNINENVVFKNIPFDEVQVLADTFAKKYNEKYGTNYTAPTYDNKWLTKKLKEINMDEGKFYKSIGSLGGGNHFIEMGKDGDGNYWVTVHCGSRNFGLKIADYWTNVAKGKVLKTPKEYTNRLQEIVEKTPIKKDIPKRIEELKKEFGLGTDKEFLKGDDLMGYLFDMIFAQQYATWNRTTIMESIKDIIGVRKFDETIETTHNYVDFKDMIIRKGAISSYVGEKMIIPWNMKDGLIIAEGKSNPDWNYSAPHGAGRLFSRSKAKEMVDLKDFQEVMKDVYSTSVCKSTLDESPFAYKNAKTIEEAIEPTATILHRVKPILNIKDTGKSISWKERKAEKKKKDINRKKERSMKRRR